MMQADAGPARGLHCTDEEDRISCDLRVRQQVAGRYRTRAGERFIVWQGKVHAMDRLVIVLMVFAAFVLVAGCAEYNMYGIPF